MTMVIMTTMLNFSSRRAGWTDCCKQESTNGEYAERFGALDQESRARVDDLMR